MTRKKVTTYVVTYSYKIDTAYGEKKWTSQMMFDIEGRVSTETFRLAVEKVTHRHIDDIIIENIFKL